jgi:hypothetical protein
MARQWDDGPAKPRAVAGYEELLSGGDYALWPDGSMTMLCPFCNVETWFNPAPVRQRGPLTTGALRAVCGHRFEVIDGKVRRL